MSLVSQISSFVGRIATEFNTLRTELSDGLATKSPLAGSSSITTVGTVTTVTSPTGSGSSGLRKTYISTSDPSGGADGDVWLKYTA